VCGPKQSVPPGRATAPFSLDERGTSKDDPPERDALRCREHSGDATAEGVPHEEEWLISELREYWLE
jgi:hypothetical protein